MHERATPQRDLTEREIRAAAAGDLQAAARIASALLERARNLVRFLIRGDQDVDDVTQEALVCVVRGLGGYRADGPFRSWADRVVVRATFAWLRARKAEQERRSQLAGLHVAEDAQTLPPDDYFARRRLVRLLDGLPFEQRHALVLHHVLELTVPEIALETGASAETVRSRLRLGRLRLREAWSLGLKQEAG